MPEMKPLEKLIYITGIPLLDGTAVYQIMEGIWRSRWLIGGGPQHLQFEKKFKKYLITPSLILFCSGTQALQLAYQSLYL